MINNDTSSIGSRSDRPNKPATQIAKHDSVPVTKDHTSDAVVQVAKSELVSFVSEVKASVQANELDKPVDGRSVEKDEAQGLNEEQKKEVTKAISEVEAFMQDNQRTLNFEMAEKDNRVIITVIDQETKEVIRQIPPDDLVRMSDAIKSGDSLANGGILIQSKA